MGKDPLKHSAYLVRKYILDISYNAHVGHIASALSVADILTVLYCRILKKQDRFILSKGHAAAALYAALYTKKYITKKQLFTYCMDNGCFGVHPDYNPTTGIEFTTGSLGHGMSVGCGLATGLTSNIYILISDAELNEGSCWEAVMFAAHHKLGNLTVIVDDNGNQAFGKTKDILDIQPIDEKFKTFGWQTTTVNGHNHKEMIKAFKSPFCDKPKAIIAKTVAGFGVSFMEGKVDWHYWPMDKIQYAQALSDIKNV